MKPMDLLDALNDADDACIRNAKVNKTNKQVKSKSLRLKWVAVAACFCILLTAAVLTVYRIAGVPGGDGPSVTTPGTDVGAIVPDPTGLGLWTYAGMNDDGNPYVTFKRLTSADIALSLNITVPEHYTRPVEEDACLVLFGQYISSLLAFDYEAHFAAFPAPLVEEEFLLEMEKYGLDFEGALHNIDVVVNKIMGFDTFDFSYSVDHYETFLPQTPGFTDLLKGSAGWFEKAEVPITEITEIRRYYFTDFSITFGDLYTKTGDPGLGFDAGFCFYQYQNRWYCWPYKIDNDLSVDLALSNCEGAEFLRQDSFTAVIESIEGDYLSFGGAERYFAPHLSDDFAVGDCVEVICYHYALISATDQNNQSVDLYRIHSVEKVTEPEETAPAAKESGLPGQ